MAGSDRAVLKCRPFEAGSFSLGSGDGRAKRPWETLEQPSLGFVYGVGKGTVTLNQ